jgi:hypothetical protein
MFRVKVKEMGEMGLEISSNNNSIRLANRMSNYQRKASFARSACERFRLQRVII